MRVKFVMPFVFLFSLLGFLGWELFYSPSRELPSALVGQDLPSFTLPNVYSDKPALRSSLLQDDVSLLNVFASWCGSCQAEHAMLMKIKNAYKVRIFGIAYKDTPENVGAFIQKNGNPYVMIGNDSTGDIGIDLGVYGTPETFIVRSGKIIYRHIGVLDQQAWDEKISPLLR